VNCKDNPKLCPKNSECLPKGDVYACECQFGFKGQNCEIDDRVCANGRDGCINNATCLDGPQFPNGWHCFCQPGFKGKQCEIDDRPCLPHKNRCKNNSTCNEFLIDNHMHYNCSCIDGFDGYHCETNIDDCFEDSCKNGGQCIDLINGFSCNCFTFFYGEFCEIKKGELVLQENVSKAFSVVAILFIISTFGFFILLDMMRYVFKIEPEGLLEERQMIKKKKAMKKMIKDLQAKHKRKKRYRRIIRRVKNPVDPFIKMLEKTFQITYETDLPWIDEERSSKSNSRNRSLKQNLTYNQLFQMSNQTNNNNNEILNLDIERTEI
jgi:hypothetical protein